MLDYSLMRLLLLFFVVTFSSVSALADAKAICADAKQPPKMRSAACAEALADVINSAERARLLIYSAQSRRLQSDNNAARVAMAYIEEAGRLLPDRDLKMWADLLFERSEVYRLSGNLDAVMSDLGAVERLAPDDADPVVSRALLLLEQGDNLGGSAQMNRALAMEPNHTRARFYAMRLAHSTGKQLACIEHATEALKASPEDVRILGMRARCLIDLKRVNEAEADLKKIQEVGPWEAAVFQDMTLAFLSLNQPNEAAVAARQAIERDPTLVDAYFDLTTALMAVGAHDEAFAAFRKFKDTGLEDRVGIANNLSWELYLAGRYTEALQISNDWLQQNPAPNNKPNHIANADGYPIVLDTAAHALAALGRSEEALRTFLRAAALSPDEFRLKYREHLRALGFAPKSGEAGLEIALRACVATKESCKLYTEN